MKDLRSLSVRREASRVIVVALFACAGAITVFAAGPTEDFQELEGELIEAHDEFMAALTAKVKSDPNLDLNDKSKLPLDKREVVLKKMDALVEANAMEPDGAEFAAATLNWSVEAGSDNSPVRFARLARLFPNAEETVSVLSNLEFMYPYAGEAPAWVEAVAALEQRTKDEDTKRLATFTIAKMLMGQERLPEAKERFQSIIKAAPEAPLSARAKGFVYEIDHLQVGMEAPDFEATTLDGKKVSLKSLRGKVVLLDFWATWCPSCIGELPHLAETLKRFADKFEILAVSADESRDAVKALGKSITLPGIHTWDKRDDTYPIVKKYNVEAFPTWYLLDAKGIIRAKDPLGPALIPAIEAALKPKGAASAKKSASQG